MSWFYSESEVLKFDTDQIRKMRNKINETINDLNNSKNKVSSAMNDLEKNWKTPAGYNFIKEVNVDWADEVTKYIRILNAVDELLKVAEMNYDEVDGEVRRLNF